jgi:hypothetical protein
MIAVLFATRNADDQRGRGTTVNNKDGVVGMGIIGMGMGMGMGMVHALPSNFGSKSSRSNRSSNSHTTRDPSSALLKLQRHYKHSPHDMALYDTLQVRHNATVLEITKSYRKLSREYHPDKRQHYYVLQRQKRKRINKHKRRRRKCTEKGTEDAAEDHIHMLTEHEREEEEDTVSSSNNEEEEEEEEEDSSDDSGNDDDDDKEEEDANADAQLERIRQAYDVLKEDVTRLPYHRYGCMDTSTAAILLTKGTFETNNHNHNNNAAGAGANPPSWEQTRLLQLMGYGNASQGQGVQRQGGDDTSSRAFAHQQVSQSVMPFLKQEEYIWLCETQTCIHTYIRIFVSST